MSEYNYCQKCFSLKKCPYGGVCNECITEKVLEKHWWQ